MQATGPELDANKTTLKDTAYYWKEIAEDSKRFANIVDNITKSLDEMVTQSNSINAAFLQSRERIQEMNVAVADSVSGIVRVGGSITDVSKTIIEIADASKRSVIESSTTVDKLFASSKVLGKTVFEISDAFQKVGMESANIGKNLEESISYVQSVGGNAKGVMSDVLKNTEQLNRFQFEGGVQGLTKMAAQASMLKFDMQNTFNLAEKVLNPEGAIETAAAFQRLGVSIGGLGDPFQLMNQSINDPSGLQDSLIKVAKQYTEFDEKTKSFKINPEGVLMLREIEDASGAARGSLAKAGLAAANLDLRLSEVKLDIPEDDKKLLANMASMGEGGEYSVKITDEEGKITTKNLTDVTKEEFDALKKIQQTAPKDMEDIARSQLGMVERISADVKAMTYRAGFGIASTAGLRKGAEDVRKKTTEGVEGLTGMIPSTQNVRKFFDPLVGDIKGILKDPTSDESKAKTLKITGDMMKEFTKGTKIGVDEMKGIFETVAKSGSNAEKADALIKKITELSDRIPKPKSSENAPTSGAAAKKSSFQSLYYGNQENRIPKEITKSRTSAGMMETTTNINQNFGGTVTFKIDAPDSVSVQYLTEFVNSQKFKDQMYGLVEDKRKELGLKR